jgi:type IV pilus assembly protein PilA
VNIQNVHFLLSLSKKDKQQLGFTMIELLLVMIIIGLLSAITFPNFINQVGKSRQTEAKINLGSLGRAQQSYHFEHKVFAGTLSELSANNMFTPKYYSYPNADAATNSLFKQRAIAISPDKDQARDYAIGVYFNAGSYQLVLCEGKGVGEVVEVPNIVSDSCTNDGLKLK